jgi:dethiobiotin synthetase
MGVRIIFITGTDTGVGKTLLTALLVSHLRANGARALALKPFCSGSRDDAQLLFDLQQGDLTLEEINPFFFPEPVAPLISARKHQRPITLDQVTKKINHALCRFQDLSPVMAKISGNKKITQSCGQTRGTTPSAVIKDLESKNSNFLLIEGSGGLLVPLGENYSVSDLISELDCEVLVVSQNRLGTINHTLLTVQALQRMSDTDLRKLEVVQDAKYKRVTNRSMTAKSQHQTRPHSAQIASQLAIKVVLMGALIRDFSALSNPGILSELLSPIPLVSIPYLGSVGSSVSAISHLARNQKRLFARILS